MMTDLGEDLWMVRSKWDALVVAWTRLSEAYRLLDRAIRAKRSAREEVARAYENLMRADEQDGPLFKTIRRLFRLRLTSNARKAAQRFDRAIKGLEEAERRRAAAEQEQARGLAVCERAKASWEREYAGYTRSEKARQILGVSPSASQDEIKKAYHEAALRCHPDLAKTNDMSTALATELFNQLNEAFEVLSEKQG